MSYLVSICSIVSDFFSVFSFGFPSVLYRPLITSTDLQFSVHLNKTKQNRKHISPRAMGTGGLDCFREGEEDLALQRSPQIPA
jgi:hypothetical protein